MAKDKTKTDEKVRLLGTVVKVHDSNNCETDKGFKVAGKFEIGAVLEQDIKTRKVSKREKKVTKNNAPTGESGNDTSANVNDANVNIDKEDESNNNSNDGEE